MKPKTIVINENTMFAAIRASIMNLPRDGTMEIVIRKHTKKRSLDQNALYWSLIAQIAEQAKVKGLQYSKNTWHQYCIENIMPQFVINKNGERVTKGEFMPFMRGIAYISTTELSKESFSEYIEAVTANAVTALGVQFEAHS